MSKVLLFFFSFHAFAQRPAIYIEPSYDELDGIKLVEALISDHKLGEAESILKKEGVLRDETKILSAKILNLKKEPQQALQVLSTIDVISDAAKIERVLAYYELKDFPSCARISFQESSKVSTGVLRILLDCSIRARDYQSISIALADRQEINVIDMKFQLLQNLSMQGQALDLAIANAMSEDYIEIYLKWFQLLPDLEKQKMIETLRLRFPNQPQVQAAWGAFEHSKGRLRSAAAGFKQAGYYDSSFHHIVAEIERTNRQYVQAAFWGAQIQDSDAQLKFKLSLCIDRQKYSELVALAGPFSRSSLVNDQDLHYAFLFSFAQQGSLKKAAYHQGFLIREDLKAKAEKILLK